MTWYQKTSAFLARRSEARSRTSTSRHGGTESEKLLLHKCRQCHIRTSSSASRSRFVLVVDQILLAGSRRMNHTVKVCKRLRDFHFLTIIRKRLFDGCILDDTERLDVCFNPGKSQSHVFASALSDLSLSIEFRMSPRLILTLRCLQCVHKCSGQSRTTNRNPKFLITCELTRFMQVLGKTYYSDNFEANNIRASAITIHNTVNEYRPDIRLTSFEGISRMARILQSTFSYKE